MNATVQYYYNSRIKQFNDGMEKYFKEHSHHSLRKYIQHWVDITNWALQYDKRDLEWRDADQTFLLWLTGV